MACGVNGHLGPHVLSRAVEDNLQGPVFVKIPPLNMVDKTVLGIVLKPRAVIPKFAHRVGLI